MAAPATALTKVRAANGISAIFNVAEEDGEHQPFAGLTLLSQVFFETGADVRPMHPMNLLYPSMRVGLRPPVNEERAKITELLPVEVARSHKFSCQTVYKHYCTQYGLKTNSLLLAPDDNNLPEETKRQRLCSKPGDFISTTIISTAGNFIGERGLLPVLEVARLCPNLEVLEFPANGLRNSACEWIAEFLLSTPSQCPKIKRIDLSGNRITIGGGKVLLRAASDPRRPTLHEINVEGTKIDVPTMKRLKEQLRSNQEKTG